MHSHSHRGGVVTAEEMAPFLDPPELTRDQLQASRSRPVSGGVEQLAFKSANEGMRQTS